MSPRRTGTVPTVSLTKPVRVNLTKGGNLLTASAERRARKARRAGEEIARRERDAKAVGLRKAGATYQEISDQCGYTHKGKAYEAIHRVLHRVDAKNADELRDLENARLDDDLVRINQIITAYLPRAQNGDMRAALLVDKALTTRIRISESRRRLFGLDAPIKIDGRIRSQFEAEIEELAGQLGIGTDRPERLPDSPAAGG